MGVEAILIVVEAIAEGSGVSRRFLPLQSCHPFYELVYGDSSYMGVPRNPVILRRLVV
jgi:hypothetical protein